MSRRTLILFLTIFVACSTQKYFPDQYHVVERKILMNKSDIDLADVESFLRVKADRKVLGIRLYTGLYLWGYSLKDRAEQRKMSWEKRHQRLKKRNAYLYQVKLDKHVKSTFKNWLMNYVGEPPSLYDTMLIKKDKENLLLYGRQKGYFNIVVQDSLVFLKKNRVKLFYIVQTGDPYKLDTIRRISQDIYMKTYLQSTSHISLLQPNMRYDEEVFEKERVRLTRDLRNNGFYLFNKDYIRFFVDTSQSNKTANIDLVIAEFSQKNVVHPRFILDRIYVFPQFSFTGENVLYQDTLTYILRRKQMNKDTIFFVYSGKISVKPGVIARRMYFSNRRWFNEQDAEKTLASLNALGIFKYTNLRYVEHVDSNNMHASRLTAFVELSPIVPNSFQIEIDATNNAGNLGMAANLVYRNKNLFRNAQQFSITTRGGLELQRTFFETDTSVQLVKALPFNSAEYSFQLNLLSPISSSLFARSAKPVSRFYANYHYQMRPNYVRYITTLSALLEFQESKNRFIQIYAPLNLVKVKPDSIFNARLLMYPKPLRYSYTDHLIPAFGVTINFNNQGSSTKQISSSRRTNVEMAGISYWIANGFNNALQNEVYKVLNIAYSQYFKVDIDQRYYIKLAENHLFAWRLFTGVGFPFGNSVILPFEKSYTASGSNDVRAWKYRTLGPGTYSDSTDIDRTGDLALVSSFEYRFPIWSWFKGAFFCDVGNIWLWHKNEEFPGGEFSLKFYQQLAVGTGVGVRLDVDFLIIRLDAAVPLRDPGHLEHPAIPIHQSFKRVNLNLGIGYPF